MFDMKWRPLLTILGIFTAGVFTGVALARWVPPPHHGPPSPVPHLAELNLTPQQRAAVEAVFDKHRPELDDIVRSTFPRVRETHDRIDREIRGVLDEAQRRRFDELRDRFRKAGPPGEPHLPGPPGRPPFGPPGWPPPLEAALPSAEPDHTAPPPLASTPAP